MFYSFHYYLLNDLAIYPAVSKTSRKQQAFLGKEDWLEGLLGEQRSGVLVEGGTSSCPISPNLLFRRGGRGLEQHHWIATKDTHTVFFTLFAWRLYSPIMPKMILTHNTYLVVALMLYPSSSAEDEGDHGDPINWQPLWCEGVFPKAFPQPSLGIIREVRKLGDFLLQKTGSECRVASSSTQQTWLGTHAGTHTLNGREAIL